MGRLENKVAFITGGAMGMGGADSELFAKEGAKVIISDIDEKVGKEKAEEIGENAFFFQMDVSSEEDWKKAYEYVKENFGHLDILVNNAGINNVKGTGVSAVPYIDFDKWEKIYGVDILGTVMGIQAMFPLMKENGGSIINIGSTGGLEGTAVMDYSSAKWAVRGVTKSVAQVLGSYNIRCNCLHPGVIKTRLTAEFPDSYTESIPLGRFGDVEEIARTTLFLASDDSSYVTGIDIPVDGGFTNAGLYNHQLKPLIDQVKNKIDEDF